jgi:hypothetical protein
MQIGQHNTLICDYCGVTFRIGQDATITADREDDRPFHSDAPPMDGVVSRKDFFENRERAGIPTSEEDYERQLQTSREDLAYIVKALAAGNERFWRCSICLAAAPNQPYPESFYSASAMSESPRPLQSSTATQEDAETETTSPPAGGFLSKLRGILGFVGPRRRK